MLLYHFLNSTCYHQPGKFASPCFTVLHRASPWRSSALGQSSTSHDQCSPHPGPTQSVGIKRRFTPKIHLMNLHIEITIERLRIYADSLRFPAEFVSLVKLSNSFPPTPNRTNPFPCQRLHQNPEVSRPLASVAVDFGPL